jgi:hypothetical protein
VSVEALFRGASIAVVRENAAGLGLTLAAEDSRNASVRLTFAPDESGKWFEATIQDDGELHVIALSSTRGSYYADLVAIRRMAGEARLVGHNRTHEWPHIPD